jgi:hypothetical protein
VNAAVLRALGKTRDERFASMEELAAAMVGPQPDTLVLGQLSTARSDAALLGPTLVLPPSAPAEAPAQVALDRRSATTLSQASTALPPRALARRRRWPWVAGGAIAAGALAAVLLLGLGARSPRVSPAGAPDLTLRAATRGPELPPVQRPGAIAEPTPAASAAPEGPPPAAVVAPAPSEPVAVRPVPPTRPRHHERRLAAHPENAVAPGSPTSPAVSAAAPPPVSPEPDPAVVSKPAPRKPPKW